MQRPQIKQLPMVLLPGNADTTKRYAGMPSTLAAGVYTGVPAINIADAA